MNRIERNKEFVTILDELSELDNFENYKEVLKKHPEFTNSISNKLLVERLILTGYKFSSGKYSIIEDEKNVYYDLLDRLKLLGDDLKLNDSLELSNLFTYMLWNGYFSKTHHHAYKTGGVFDLRQLAFYIFEGYGVCMQYASMLTDFLNRSGIDSSTLINYLKINDKIDLNLSELDRDIIGILYNDILYGMATKISPIVGNHAVTLTNLDGNYYLYDPTNLLFFNIKDQRSGEVIDEKGEIDFKPFFSYAMSLERKDTKALDALLTNDSFEKPVDVKLFENTWNSNFELFENNKSLLEDFYTDSFENINYLSDHLDKSGKILRLQR